MHRLLSLLLGGLLATAACAPFDSTDDAKAPASTPATAAPQVEAEPATQRPDSPGPQKGEPKERGQQIPPWLGQRELEQTADGFAPAQDTPRALRKRAFTLPDSVAPLGGRGFNSRAVSPPPARVLRRSTWSAACPVPAEELAWVRLKFWGFDERSHTGELLVNAAVAQDIVQAFSMLYRDRFPIEEMRITPTAELDAKPTGDGNNTGSFVCRPRVEGSSWSMHASGQALDINPFQNPYVRGDVVLPELASAYTDRSREWPGMIRPQGAVTRAFASIGWRWGGDWRNSKDYQHFSINGQ